MDPKVGGYLHDVLVEHVEKALRELVAHARCVLVISTHPCNPWCSLRGHGKGPEVIFNIDEPDGITLEDGTVNPLATQAMRVLTAVVGVLETALAAGKEVLIEGPVGRGRASPWAIATTPLHSTSRDTTVFRKLLGKFPLCQLPIDQCMPPSCADSQKTTMLLSTPTLHELAAARMVDMKCDAQVYPHQHKSLKGTADNEGGYATAGSEKFTSGFCRLLAIVSIELVVTLRGKKLTTPSAESHSRVP